MEYGRLPGMFMVLEFCCSVFDTLNPSKELELDYASVANRKELCARSTDELMKKRR